MSQAPQNEVTVIWTLLGIFVGGVILDVLQAAYVRHAAHGSRFVSAVLSGSLTLCSILLWSTLLQNHEALGIPGALAFAGGSMLGTLAGVKRV